MQEKKGSIGKEFNCFPNFNAGKLLFSEMEVMNLPETALPAKLREGRIKKKWNQEEAAQQLGVSRSRVAQTENGHKPSQDRPFKSMIEGARPAS